MQRSSESSGAKMLPPLEVAANNLEPGEALILRYDLRATDASDFTARITLKTRKTLGHRSGPRLHGSVSGGQQTLAMCLPGFRLEEVDAQTTAKEAALDPGYAAMRLALKSGWLRELEIESHEFGHERSPLLRLPVLDVGSIRVDRLLEALIASGQAESLSVEAAKICLGPHEIKIIARTREALRAREMSLPPDGAEAALVRYHIAFLQGWAVAGAGISLSFRLGFECKPSPNVVRVAADMLYGARPKVRLAPVDAQSPDLDFSLSFASMMKAPVLLPAAADLDRLGFLSRRRWRRPTDARTDCQIGCTPEGDLVSLAPTDLDRHVYIIGATGVGKSTLMARMIRQDIDAGLPSIVIDPHGDLFSEISLGLSDDQRQRAITADLAAIEGGFGLDLLDTSGTRPDIRLNFVCNQLIAVFRKVLYRDQPEGFGPMFESYFRNALMLLVLGSPSSCSLSDFDRVFGDPKYRSDLLANCKDEMVTRFWKQTAVRAGGEAALENIAPYIVSKLTQFTGSPLIRPLIDGSRTSLNFGRIFDERGILLINLAKGAVGEADAALVGALFTIDLFATALARSSVTRNQRNRVRLYMDEFQSYASDVLSQMLAECRKFGLELVLANQSLTQISGARSKPDIADAILANVGTVLAFRTGPRDARQLEEWFAPSLDAAALMRLPDHNFAARLLQDGVPLEPFIALSQGRFDVPQKA